MDDPGPAQSPTAHRPSRFLKFLFDTPAALYRMGLGWMLGKRVLALTHTGRKSGRPYTTILEVAVYDGETRESVVASAYGSDADWYRNIQETPALRIRTGRHDYEPAQRFLTQGEAREAAIRFCNEHPWEAKLVPRVLPSIGAAVSADENAAPEELLASLPMVAFRPKS